MLAKLGKEYQGQGIQTGERPRRGCTNRGSSDADGRQRQCRQAEHEHAPLQGIGCR